MSKYLKPYMDAMKQLRQIRKKNKNKESVEEDRHLDAMDKLWRRLSNRDVCTINEMDKDINLTSFVNKVSALYECDEVISSIHKNGGSYSCGDDLAAFIYRQLRYVVATTDKTKPKPKTISREQIGKYVDMLNVVSARLEAVRRGVYSIYAIQMRKGI